MSTGVLNPPIQKARSMPSMASIAKYWAKRDPSWLRSHYIGWGEPFCFACGWLAPVSDWVSAQRWFDRAHLQDRFFGGPDEPHNIVPLCHLCHHDMPDSETFEFGLQWVQNRPQCHWLFQVITDDGLTGVCNPSRNTTLLRAQVRFLQIMAQHGMTSQAAG